MLSSSVIDASDVLRSLGPMALSVLMGLARGSGSQRDLPQHRRILQGDSSRLDHLHEECPWPNGFAPIAIEAAEISAD